jgi:hypothetical protein
MNDSQNTKTCNHATNGSFLAFVDGFRTVTGREPEEFIDYRFCCNTLDKFNAETLTEEQLGECRACGDRHGRRALEDGPNWKTVKLRSDEIEQLVRWHLAADADSWMEEHLFAACGVCISGSTSRRFWYAMERLDYFYFTSEIGLRMEEIRCDVWREKIGGWVKECDCNLCLETRDWLFPDLVQEWKQKSEEPLWQAFTAEVRRQFPAISINDLSLVTQRTIQGGQSPALTYEAARRAVELHARWQSDYEASVGQGATEEEALHKTKPQIDSFLAKWRGEVGATSESKPAIDPQVQPYSLF